MKISSNRFLFLFISLHLILSCKKDGLTKATQKGANTFSCKINGKVFIPKDVVTFPVTPGLSSYYDESKKSMRLYAVEPPNEKENRLQRHVTINVYNLKVGNNNLNEGNYSKVVIVEMSQLDKYYETNDTIGGTLNITRLDTIKNIISGTFSFYAALRPNNSSIINVTDGRFDISYKP